jgi:hypothetical protein
MVVEMSEKITVDFNREAVVFHNEMGELVERLAMLIGGHDVQILRFNGNDELIMVKVDKSINIMPKEQINEFIKARL